MVNAQKYTTFPTWLIFSTSAWKTKTTKTRVILGLVTKVTINTQIKSRKYISSKVYKLQIYSNSYLYKTYVSAFSVSAYNYKLHSVETLSDDYKCTYIYTNGH